LSGNGIEIERKFLLHPLILADLAIHGFDRHLYTNYYLTNGDVETRVHQRRRGDWVLTFKRGSGHVRQEVEVAITHHEAAALLKLGPQAVAKTRVYIGNDWTVDVYTTPFKGLVTAEIETLTPDTEIELPEILRNAAYKEVTGNENFANKNLAACSAQRDHGYVFEHAERILGLSVGTYQSLFNL
jgi:CYTH domain-containing protein